MTNYVSAVDGAVHVHFDADNGQLLEGEDDTGAQLHRVWNDVWMRRDDLPDGNDGWQAVDAGADVTEPTSLAIVRHGLATMGRGQTQFRHALNAPTCYWLRSAYDCELLNRVCRKTCVTIVPYSHGLL